MRGSGLNRWTIRRAATTGALYATAAAVLVVIVFPIYWMFSLSVKTEIELFALPPSWLPSPTIENYPTAFRTRPLHRYIINSVVITTATTVLSVAVGALAGYGFSRFPLAGSRYLLLAMLATRMIPPITLVFPLFVIMRDLGLLNTHAALILAHTTFNIPFATFLMHGFMAAVPRELDEKESYFSATKALRASATTASTSFSSVARHSRRSPNATRGSTIPRFRSSSANRSDLPRSESSACA